MTLLPKPAPRPRVQPWMRCAAEEIAEGDSQHVVGFLAEIIAKHFPVKPKRAIDKYKVDESTEAVRAYTDLRGNVVREVCRKNESGREEYRHRIKLMWIRDGYECCICHNRLDLREATFEHKDGRGMGGGRRDDRIEKNGVAHLRCNSTKGSKRL